MFPTGNGPAANFSIGSSSSGAVQSSNCPTSSATSSRFDALEQTLEMFVENARHLCLIVSDFPGGASASFPSTASSGGGGGSSSGGANSQAVMNQKLQTLVCGLQELDQSRHQFQDVKIPMELFDQYVDKGRNPQLYTKECMERTLNKNKEINGKVELYKKFRAHLLKELSEEFPKETMQYRAIREQMSSAPSSSFSSNGSSMKQESETR